MLTAAQSADSRESSDPDTHRAAPGDGQRCGEASMRLLGELPVDYLKTGSSLIAGRREDRETLATLQRSVDSRTPPANTPSPNAWRTRQAWSCC